MQRVEIANAYYIPNVFLENRVTRTPGGYSAPLPQGRRGLARRLESSGIMGRGACS